MAHTRTWNPKAKTMILMPFPRLNSKGHIDSTLGVTESFDCFGTTLTRDVEPGWSRYKSDVFGRNVGVKFTESDVICADDLGCGAKLATLQGADDMLYLRGHGSKGCSTISSADQKQKRSAQDIVDLLGKGLPQEGLPKSFAGVIKIYACESGTDYNWFWQAFAQQFADAMWEAGYRACRFYGYTASVSSFAEAKDGLGRNRKAAVDKAQGYKVLGAASSRRVEVTPINKEVNAILSGLLTGQPTQ
jgi:hypothetical protein